MSYQPLFLRHGLKSLLLSLLLGQSVCAYADVTVSTVAGNGFGFQGTADGTGRAARFYFPKGVAVDSTGNFAYVADFTNNTIRKIILGGAAGGIVSTWAGSGVAGSMNDTGTAASFNQPSGVAVDSAGNVYVADSGSNMIRKITPAGAVTTLAGSAVAGSTNATGTAASFNYPAGIAVDNSGNLYVADSGNNLIRKITPAGAVTTLAGSGTSGSTNDTGTAASFKQPSGVAVDSAGTVYVADSGNNLIRKITPAGAVTTLAGGGMGAGCNAYIVCNGTGTAANFAGPKGVAVDSSGNIYVADYFFNLIRKITPAGVVTTLAGTGEPSSKDGAGTVATFNTPAGVAVDNNGNIYVADYTSNMIREIATQTSGGTNQTIGSLSFSPATLIVGANTTVSTTASSGAVSFTSLTPAVCSVNGSSVTGIAAGTCTIVASQAGASQVTQSIQVTQLLTSQTITISPAPPATLAVGGSFSVSANATSGLPVVITSLTPSVCSATTFGSTLVVGNIAGICTIAATQAGNSTYSAAPQVTQSITIGGKNQTIGPVSFLPTVLTKGGNATISATASSGLTVSFSSLTPNICSVSGTTVTGKDIGTCTVAADQAGSDNYGAAPQVTQSLTVGNPSDSYNSTNNQLTIPTVVVKNIYNYNKLGIVTYTNVVIAAGTVLSVGSAPAQGTYDTYDGTLTIPTVSVDGKATYYNVKVTIKDVLSVGGGVWSAQ